MSRHWNYLSVQEWSRSFLMSLITAYPSLWRVVAPATIAMKWKVSTQDVRWATCNNVSVKAGSSTAATFIAPAAS